MQLRFAEILNDDGTLYTDNLRTAKATDRFILSGKGTEEYQARFTFHGFRYVELTGLTTPPDIAAVKAVVLHTDAPFTMQFHSASPMINQLWSNILWGQRSNFISVPTDCPQRDERLGWSADAQVFWRTAAYNMDLATFSQKFTGDLRGTQSGTDMFGIFAPGTVTSSAESAAGWSDAGVVIPSDRLVAVRRYASRGAELGGHGALPFRHSIRESGSPLDKKLRHPVRGLAGTG